MALLLCKSILVCLDLSAQTFQADSASKLQYIVQKLDLFEKIDSLSDGSYPFAFSYKGCPLTIVKKKGMVDHIGYSLFTMQQKELYPSPIYNFLERYSLELDLPRKEPFSVDKRLKIDKVHFYKGDFSVLKNLGADSTLVLTITRSNDKSYLVSWEKDSVLLCSVRFPINYELIVGKNRIENESLLPQAIIEHVCDSGIVQNVKMDYLELYGDSIKQCYILRCGYNGISSMANNKYYIMEDDSINMCKRLNLIYSSDFPIESFYNLFTSHSIDNDFISNINMFKSNFKKETFSVPLNKLLCFFSKEGCEPYIGVLSYDTITNMVEAVIEMRNNDLAYEHMLKVEMNLNQLPSKSGHIEITLWPYIPTQYLK